MTECKIFPVHAFDGDFRKLPKTNNFCVVCQRDIKTGKEGGFVYLSEGCHQIEHPDNPKKIEQLFPVGSQCAKTIPSEFLVEEKINRRSK